MRHFIINKKNNKIKSSTLLSKKYKQFFFYLFILAPSVTEITIPICRCKLSKQDFIDSTC